MTPEQKKLIRRTWAQLAPDSAATAALFYQRLFAIEPAARRLFESKDMHVQGNLFMQMVSVFVRSLDGHSEMNAAIESSGKRHHGYGVLASDYDGAGKALLWALEQALGSAFTPEIRDAWAEGYRTLAGTMQRAGATSTSGYGSSVL
ncbi:MAG TPA: globin domain-containing protein [Candidatus Dormibacteraeota bacterium]|nr:globin domain-containing protein [Candidatus Dormibacteraeota bacterium]